MAGGDAWQIGMISKGAYEHLSIPEGRWQEPGEGDHPGPGCPGLMQREQAEFKHTVPLCVEGGGIQRQGKESNASVRSVDDMREDWLIAAPLLPAR